MTMSLPEAPPRSWLPRGRPLTAADLSTVPDDGHRYELIDGTLIVSAAPRPIHQDVLRNLLVAFDSAVPDTLKVYIAPLDVRLSDDTLVQPDVLIAPRAAFTDTNLPIAPLLAVEVLSPSTRGIDQLLKRDRYERAGVEHYWIVDPAVPSLLALRVEHGTYEVLADVSGDESWTSAEPVAVTVVPSALVR